MRQYSIIYIERKLEYKEIYTMLLFITSHIYGKMIGMKYVKY